MILWLDHLIFGNGYGMRTPFWDCPFYWLNGELYTASSGLGAQLHSIQWRHPKPQERRLLCGREFKPFISTRRWLRVQVSWAMVGLPKDINDANATIRQFRTELAAL